MKDPFTPKFFTLLHSGLDKQQVLSDIMAGVVVGIVALPLSIAFAVASGVSPERGLITGIMAGFLIAFLGGSRVQIGGSHRSVCHSHIRNRPAQRLPGTFLFYPDGGCNSHIFRSSETG